MTGPRLVLASRSPRRRELLDSIGLVHDVVAVEVDERPYPDEEPELYVERVARAKALAVEAGDAVVLAADTAVAVGGHLLGKPTHPAEARSMLRRLSGLTHEVVTAVAISAPGAEPVSAVERTLVRMLDLTDDEIDAYVATGEPMDKAGAYGLQGLGAIFVEWVDGSPSNVIGLPLHVVARLLRAVGIDPLSPRERSRPGPGDEPVSGRELGS